MSKERIDRLLKALSDIAKFEPNMNHSNNLNDLIAVAAVRVAEAAIARDKV